MEKIKIKQYCQFCLKDQNETIGVPINDEIRKVFSDLTNIDVSWKFQFYSYSDQNKLHFAVQHNTVLSVHLPGALSSFSESDNRIPRHFS